MELKHFIIYQLINDFPNWSSPFPNFGLSFLFQSEMLACLLFFFSFFFFKSGRPTVEFLKFYFLQQDEHVFKNIFKILLWLILPKLWSLYDRREMLATNREGKIKSFQTQAFYKLLNTIPLEWIAKSVFPRAHKSSLAF